MALEYTLEVSTELEPAQTLQLMFSSIGIETNIEQSDKHGVMVSTSGPGFTTYAFSSGDEQRYLTEELGITTNVTILFRLDKFANIEVAKTALVRATIELLRQIQRDAVLLFNGEEVVLLQKVGQLTLNKSREFWTPSYLALVTLPYEMRDIPVL